jgi:hypothetical protein
MQLRNIWDYWHTVPYHLLIPEVLHSSVPSKDTRSVTQFRTIYWYQKCYTVPYHLLIFSLIVRSTYYLNVVILWEVTPCSRHVNRCFGGSCHFYLQGCHLLHAGFLFDSLSTPKMEVIRWFTYRPHGAISQNRVTIAATHYLNLDWLIDWLETVLSSDMATFCETDPCVYNCVLFLSKAKYGNNADRLIQTSLVHKHVSPVAQSLVKATCEPSVALRSISKHVLFPRERVPARFCDRKTSNMTRWGNSCKWR